MKRLKGHIILLFVLLCTFVQGQTNFGNEWIEFNKTYFKIRVSKNGLYRIPYSSLQQLQQYGLDLSTITGDQFNLFHMGEAVPIYVSNTGILGPGDYIEFYGEYNDGSFDTQLFADPDDQMHTYYSMFTSVAVYFLTWDTDQPNRLIQNISNNLSGTLPPIEPFYIHTHREIFTDDYSIGKPVAHIDNPPKPVYEPAFSEGEGWTGCRFYYNHPGCGDGDGSYKDFEIPTPTAYNAPSIDAELKAVVLSPSTGKHHLQVKFNNTLLSDLIWDDGLESFQVNKFDFNIPFSQLRTASDNILRIEGPRTNDVNNQAVAMYELTYPSQFNFTGRTKLLFEIQGNSGEKLLQIGNLDNEGTNPILYDLDNDIRMVGGTGNPVEFRLPNGPTSGYRKLYITSQSSANISTVTFSQNDVVNFINYTRTANQGDYVIITHPTAAKDGSGYDYVNDYAKYRASSDGGNHEVTVAMIDQLYDQFAYGIQKHPMAIRNFINFALDRWQVQPQYLFLIGKGRQYNDMRKNTSAFNQCLIPTFGNPGSDQLLTASTNSIVPQVATGRLSVENGDQVRIYLEKIKAFERKQREAGDPYQTIDNKAWMKRVLHFGGGLSISEQTTYKNYLDGFKKIIEDTLYGGDVHSFFKTSSSPIQIVQSDRISHLINNGVSLMTFFGHSSANSFDISIDEPHNYQNFEKYPLILSNGCFTGNIYNPDPGISEEFVLIEDKGAIGFISTISLSSSIALNYYSSDFYENLGVKYYGGGIGTIMQKTIENIENNVPSANNKTIAEEMTLHGDPAIKLNTHALPDYALEPQMVSFNPSTVTVADGSFDVQVIVTNLGRAIDDSINLRVVRTLPDGSNFAFVKRFQGTKFSDTLTYTIPVGSSDVFGLNTFEIEVDSDHEIDELSETNNKLGNIQLNILSEDVFPIYPYEFAIVPKQNITLKASTANAFAEEKTYIMEIDTTERFNSPVKKSTTITQSGGVLKWTPPLTYEDSTVYYWRVGLDTTLYGNNYGFHNSSFIFLDGSYPGWNQSHYYQYLKDDYGNNIFLDNDRIFKYAGDIKGVSVQTGTAGDIYSGGGLLNDEIYYHLNNVQMHRWICGGQGYTGGLTFAVFDPVTGQPWSAKIQDQIADAGSGSCNSGYDINSIYECIDCGLRPEIFGFSFPTSNSCWQDRIERFIGMIPNGYYVLVYSVNKADYPNWQQSLIDSFQNLGSTLITTLHGGSGWAPWAFFAKKGNPGSVEEQMKTSKQDVLNFQTTFEVQWYEGKVTTPPIGPAYEWGSVHWRHHAQEPQPFDNSSVDVIGIHQNGSETVLMESVTALDTSITHIDANTYPFLKLRLNTRDDSTRTPTQLDYWRVLYEKVPEAALNPNIHFDFTEGPLNIGESVNLSIAMENVTEIPMDSMLTWYTFSAPGLSPTKVDVRYDSLLGLEVMNAELSYNTDCNCLGKLNNLIVEINPDNDQPEQFHFNNIGILSFSLDEDNINPLLDVTFDGVHILDGDLVSAKPEIAISLKDENQYLALDDTSLINILITYPDGQLKRLPYDGITTRFYPADLQSSNNNRARVIIDKEFMQSGEYQLSVQAKDKSSNISGTYGNLANGIDYRISFKVEREAKITHVLNYPNPFTSSTRFVFTLTGVQPPSFMKIQILTVTGKVVREITLAELGPIRVGKNITEFAWDGTDQYGDPLGNGLYLYRVIASIDGKPLDIMESGADKYFKSGFGKMYLAR